MQQDVAGNFTPNEVPPILKMLPNVYNYNDVLKSQ